MDVLAFELDGDAFAAVLATEAGPIEVVANYEFRREGRADALYLRRIHVGGPGANALRTSEARRFLRDFVTLCREMTDVQIVILEGARRTTGAKPGRTPPPWRFD